MEEAKLSALEAWKARSEREVTLPTGTKVHLRLTTVADQIVAGSFSTVVLPIARQYESGKLDVAEDLTDEMIRKFREFKNTLVAASITKVDGEDVKLTADDILELPGDDQDELWQYAVRLRPLSKGATD